MIEQRPADKSASRPAPPPTRQDRARMARAFDAEAARNRQHTAHDRARRDRGRRAAIAAVLDRVVATNRKQQQEERGVGPSLPLAAAAQLRARGRA